MKTFLKILKYALYVLGIAGVISFLVFFVLGIYKSCVEDDIITAQNRINSAYMFLWMLLSGVISLGCLLPTLAIKEEIYFDHFLANVKKLFNKKETTKE